MTKHPYTLVELAGRVMAARTRFANRDPDDWPELTPDQCARFEEERRTAQDDDLVDAVDLDGVRFFVHKREVVRVSHWDGGTE